MQWPQFNLTPVLAVLIGCVTMFVGIGSSLIISQRASDGDIVITSDPRAFEIVVEVRGDVLSPGVYRLPQDARLADLLSAAGGTTGDADLAPHNLARRLNDAEVVIIDRAGLATPIVSGTDTEMTAPISISARININTATATQLETLQGIGPALAQRIIDDRTHNGPYRDVAELTRVSGISEKLLAEIRNQITVGP
jgi:competence protein ComEA